MKIYNLFHHFLNYFAIHQKIKLRGTRSLLFQSKVLYPKILGAS